jgi:Domain of Unknown Function (DUF1080)
MKSHVFYGIFELACTLRSGGVGLMGHRVANFLGKKMNPCSSDMGPGLMREKQAACTWASAWITPKISQLLLIALVLFPGAMHAQESPAPQKLFDGSTLQGWTKTNFGGEAEVRVEDGCIVLGMGAPLTGVTWSDPTALPFRMNYELTLEARRVEGSDFFCGLTFPYHDDSASLIVGGWGGSLVGISCLDRADASENETTRIRKFEKEKWYTIRLRVREGRLQAWIDDKMVVDCLIGDRKLSTRSEVRLCQPLGICSFQTKAQIRNVTIKGIEPEPSPSGTP